MCIHQTILFLFVIMTASWTQTGEKRNKVRIYLLQQDSLLRFMHSNIYICVCGGGACFLTCVCIFYARLLFMLMQWLFGKGSTSSLYVYFPIKHMFTTVVLTTPSFIYSCFFYCFYYFLTHFSFTIDFQLCVIFKRLLLEFYFWKKNDQVFRYTQALI